jgi:hypothetical protein
MFARRLFPSRAAQLLLITILFCLLASCFHVDPHMSTARSDIAAATVNGKVYAMGRSGTDGTLNTLEIHDPATNAWTLGPNMP